MAPHDLELRKRQVADGTNDVRYAIQAALKALKTERVFSEIRDKIEQSEAPESERASCRELWEDVDALLK